MKFPNSIDCVNFELGEECIALEELMSSLVYSPSGGYAVAFKEIKNVTSLFILDSLNMKFYQYSNKNPENEAQLKMDVFYWYTDVSLVVVTADVARTFQQTMIFLDHSTRTFGTAEPKSYDFSPFDGQLSKCPLLPIEAKPVELNGDKFVIWIAEYARLSYFHITYVIPYQPNSDLNLKRFLLPLTFLGDLGDKSKIIETISNTLRQNACSVVECAPLDTTKITEYMFCKSRGPSKQYGANFATVAKERIPGDNIVTTIHYTDFASKSVSIIYRYVDHGGRNTCLSFTPYNVLIAREASSNRINCSTLTLPIGNSLLSLKDTVLRHTYLNPKYLESYVPHF